MKKQPVLIYDTTLRDGTQGSGVSLTVEDKLRIARRLDNMRFDYIEGGWPGSNPKDEEFFRRAKVMRLNYAKIAAFGSTRKPCTTPQDDQNLQYLVGADTPTVTIFGKSSPFQVKEALRTTLEENLNMIYESVAYLKLRGRQVIYDAEHFFDGFQEDKAYAIKTLLRAEKAGTDFIVLCDTNGGTHFSEIGAITAEVIRQLHARLGIHAHNDRGYGVANSEAAVAAGVEMIQGTINGVGERTGNANLITILGNLHKMGIATNGSIDLSQLRVLSRYFNELANLPHDPRQPYIGDSAFAHKGGIHVDAVLKNPMLYEHVKPAIFGNQRHFLVSDLAGTAHLEALEIFGILKKDPLARKILQELKTREHKGYSYENAEGSLELLVREMKGERIQLFQLIEYRISDTQIESGNSETFAFLRIKVNGDEVPQMQYGNGPVNALDNALRLALRSKFPELEDLRLVDYRVREISQQKGTASSVKVVIDSEFRGRKFGTVGVGENNTRAAWEALVDSYNYAHLLKQRE